MCSSRNTCNIMWKSITSQGQTGRLIVDLEQDLINFPSIFQRVHGHTFTCREGGSINGWIPLQRGEEMNEWMKGGGNLYGNIDIERKRTDWIFLLTRLMISIRLWEAQCTPAALHYCHNLQNFKSEGDDDEFRRVKLGFKVFQYCYGLSRLKRNKTWISIKAIFTGYFHFLSTIIPFCG